MSWMLAVALWAGSVEDVRTHWSEAVGAYQSGDGDAMLESTSELVRLRPDSPTLLYFHAGAHAMAGVDGAVPILTRIADMGVSVNASREPAFQSLHDDPRFKEIVSRFDRNLEPAGEAIGVARWRDGHYIPEQVEVHPTTGDLFVGSIRKRTIQRMNPTGEPEFAAPGHCGLMSIFGMHMHPQRDQLWVATTGAAESPDTPENRHGAAGIVVFDGHTGECLGQHWMPEGDRPHWLGDFAFAGEVIYGSDSLNGRIWRFSEEDGWRVALDSGALASPQGIAVNATGTALFVADYTGGIYRFDPKTQLATYIQPEPDMNTFGVDGLYRHGEWLIAIQNGHRPHRVAAFRLNEAENAFVEQRILASGLKEFDDPTLGDIHDGNFYFVANSHWPSFDADKNLPPPEEMTGPLIMRIGLEGLE